MNDCRVLCPGCGYLKEDCDCRAASPYHACPDCKGDPCECEEWTWTTRDGRKLRLPEIEDRHLLNIQRMVYRQYNQFLAEAYSGLAFLQGEMAIDAAESSIAQGEHEFSENIAIIDNEVARRGLKAL